MPVRPFEDGQIFAGRYQILRCVASGGMGAVYEAIHQVTGRRCALKVMLDHTLGRPELRDRFMLESRVAAQIGSEYIVDVLDAGVDDDTQIPFLVMEMLDGEDLGERVLRLGPLSFEDTVLYLWHAALALDRTHRANIVHRDLKASNLFLTQREDGTPLVKVLDFGVAKVMPLGRTTDGATQTVGTPIYMAPEQFKMEGRISPATDIYALGMLSYTLLVGAHYWRAEHDRAGNAFAFASLAVHGPPERASVRAAREGVTLPKSFDEWFSVSTARLPEQRFASATDAVRALSAALGLETPASVPISGTTSSVEPPSGPRASEALGPGESSRAAEHPPRLATTAPDREFLSPTATDSGSFPRLHLVTDEASGVGRAAAISSESLERTHASLSVTSGGLDAGLQRARSRRRWAVVGLSGAALTAVTALALWQRSRSASEQAADTGASVVAPAHAPEVPSSAPAQPVTGRVVHPDPPPSPAPVTITSLEALPTVRESAPQRQRRRNARRASSAGAAADPSTAASTRTEAAPPPPSGARGSITRELPTGARKPGEPRESLYSQD